MLKLFFCISRLHIGELGQRLDSIRTGLPFAAGAFPLAAAELTLRNFIRDGCDKLANEPVLQPDESAFPFRHPVVLRDRFWKGGSVSHRPGKPVNKFCDRSGRGRPRIGPIIAARKRAAVEFLS